MKLGGVGLRLCEKLAEVRRVRSITSSSCACDLLEGEAVRRFATFANPAAAAAMRPPPSDAPLEELGLDMMAGFRGELVGEIVTSTGEAEARRVSFSPCELDFCSAFMNGRAEAEASA